MLAKRFLWWEILVLLFSGLRSGEEGPKPLKVSGERVFSFFLPRDGRGAKGLSQATSVGRHGRRTLSSLLPPFVVACPETRGPCSKARE